MQQHHNTLTGGLPEGLWPFIAEVCAYMLVCDYQHNRD
ncbi:hypothetical protein P9112_006480 [Eukaryota sp. TZLM1-RC]